MKRMTRVFDLLAVAILIATVALPQRLAAQASEDGVKVHGHWVIEVRNADGTLAERREFQNALHGEGLQLLNGLLSGQASLTGTTPIGVWAVILRLDASSSDRCGVFSGTTVTNAVCTTEASHPLIASHLFKNLTKSLDQSTGAFRLQGSVTMATAASIIEVGTTVLATLGSGAGEVRFTSKGLASPIAVQATQSVSITVTISFS